MRRLTYGPLLGKRVADCGTTLDIVGDCAHSSTKALGNRCAVLASIVLSDVFKPKNIVGK